MISDKKYSAPEIQLINLQPGRRFLSASNGDYNYKNPWGDESTIYNYKEEDI